MCGGPILLTGIWAGSVHWLSTARTRRLNSDGCALAGWFLRVSLRKSAAQRFNSRFLSSDPFSSYLTCADPTAAAVMADTATVAAVSVTIIAGAGAVYGTPGGTAVFIVLPKTPVG